MTSKFILFTSIVLAASLLGYSEGNPLQRTARSVSSLSDINCSAGEMTSMLRGCMMSGFATGANLLRVMRMMMSSTCTRDLVDCNSVVETQQCLDHLDISDACRQHVDKATDYYFDMFRMPCRIHHFQQFCTSELEAAAIPTM